MSRSINLPWEQRGDYIIIPPIWQTSLKEGLRRTAAQALITNLLEGSRLIVRQRAWARFGRQATNSFGATA